MALGQIGPLAFASSFLEGFVGARQQSQQKEQALLVNAINNAVQQGQPEALQLLNPNRLAMYGLDQFLPMYHQIATQIGKQKVMEQRRIEAATRTAESQARVAEGTEQATIELTGAKAQKAQMDLSNAQIRQQFIAENPRLLMLPEDMQLSQMENIKSQITERAAHTQIAWKTLAIHQQQVGASIANMNFDNQMKKLQLGMMQERQGMEKEKFEMEKVEFLENSMQKKINAIQPRLTETQKTFEATYKSINDRAQKEGKEPLLYKTEEQAMADLTALMQPALLHNSYAEQAEKLLPGQTLPRFPEFEIVPVPGWFGSTSGYRIVFKSSSNLMDEVQQFLQQQGIQPSTAKPQPKVEKPTQKGVESKARESVGGLTPGAAAVQQQTRERLRKKAVGE